MLFPKLFSGGHVGDPLVEYRQVKEFSIIPQEENLLNIDGEMIGSTPIHVIVEQGLVNVLV
jgi:diacylglycerol kinase family enzyme